MRMIARWWSDRNGATAVEYGLIVGVIALTIIAGISSTFNAVQHLFEDSNNELVRVTR